MEVITGQMLWWCEWCVDSDHYSNKVLPDSDLVLPACGELVVVRCTANERWYRAAVIGRDLDHNIKVTFVFSLSVSMSSFNSSQNVHLFLNNFTVVDLYSVLVLLYRNHFYIKIWISCTSNPMGDFCAIRFFTCAWCVHQTGRHQFTNGVKPFVVAAAALSPPKQVFIYLILSQVEPVNNYLSMLCSGQLSLLPFAGRQMST